MAFTFDSLSYAKHLRDTGVPQDQAEAHAEAARTFPARMKGFQIGHSAWRYAYRTAYFHGMNEQ